MSTVKANDLQNNSGGIPTASGGKQLIPTAWVNFSGEGTVGINDSENISSITDNGSGAYTVNFSALATTHYAVAATAGYYNAGNHRAAHTFSPTTTSISLGTTVDDGVNQDMNRVYVVIFGGQ